MLEIRITFPFNNGMCVVSHACLISEVRSLSAMQTSHKLFIKDQPS